MARGIPQRGCRRGPQGIRVTVTIVNISIICLVVVQDFVGTTGRFCRHSRVMTIRGSGGTIHSIVCVVSSHVPPIEEFQSNGRRRILVASPLDTEHGLLSRKNVRSGCHFWIKIVVAVLRGKDIIIEE